MRKVISLIRRFLFSGFDFFGGLGDDDAAICRYRPPARSPRVKGSITAVAVVARDLDHVARAEIVDGLHRADARARLCIFRRKPDRSA